MRRRKRKIEKEGKEEEKKRRTRKEREKGEGIQSSLLGHFKVPLPISSAMLYFSSPSGWSTILKVISCYPETLTWLELLVSSSSSLSVLSLSLSPSLSLSLSLLFLSLYMPLSLRDLGSTLQRVTNTTRINVICWSLL